MMHFIFVLTLAWFALIFVLLFKIRNNGYKAREILKKGENQSTIPEKMDRMLEELFETMPVIYFGDLPENDEAAKFIKRKRKYSIILYIVFLGLMAFASLLHHYGIIEAVSE